MATSAVAALVVASIWLFTPLNEFSGNLRAPQNEGVEMDTSFWADGFGGGLEIEDAPEGGLSQGEGSSQLRSANLKGSDIPANCQWSSCEGLMILGQVICNRHGAGYYYVGYTKKSDCKWDCSRSECCKAGQNRRWSKRCFGNGYLPVKACQMDFGHGVVPTGRTKSCKGIAMTQYECGN